MDGFAISLSSAIRGSLAWCRSAMWSSTNSPSASMNTVRCENILRPVEPRGINHTLKSESAPHAIGSTFLEEIRIDEPVELVGSVCPRSHPTRHVQSFSLGRGQYFAVSIFG